MAEVHIDALYQKLSKGSVYIRRTKIAHPRFPKSTQLNKKQITYICLQFFQSINQLILFGNVILLLHQRMQQIKHMKDRLIIELALDIKLYASLACKLRYLIFHDCQRWVVIAPYLNLAIFFVLLSILCFAARIIFWGRWFQWNKTICFYKAWAI